MPPYQAKFPVGCRVRVAGQETLERFLREWRYHDPIQPEQMEFAGTVTSVSHVGFYHGGDPLYELSGVPGVWHEVCLVSEAARDLEDILDALGRFHQRATYGAVAGVVSRPPAFLMSGYPRNHRHSWIVNGDTLLPTGYTEDERDPQLLQRDAVIESAADLEEWLRDPS